MNRIAAACGAFNAFGSISCMLIVKHIWTYFTWNLHYINSLSLEREREREKGRGAEEKRREKARQGKARQGKAREEKRK